jgi:hypothetical protein
MKRTIQILLTSAIGIFLMWFMFREISWVKLWESLKQVRVGWIALSFLPMFISFFTRIQRWSYVVRASNPDVSWRAMFSATQIGFMANFTLPLRVGEAIRALILARLGNLPFSRGFAMVALDRVTDIVGLLAIMMIAVFAYQPTAPVVIPPELLDVEKEIGVEQLYWAAYSAAGVLVVVMLGLVALYVAKPTMLRISDACFGLVSKKLASLVNRLASNFADGLHVFRSIGDMSKSIFFTLVTWTLFVAGSACLLEAFNLDWPWYTPFLLQAALAAAISIPGAPGFVGQIQIGVYVGLKLAMPDMEHEDLLAIGLVLHVVQLIPVLIFGIFCLFWENMSIFELRRASEKAEAHLEDEDSDDA